MEAAPFSVQDFLSPLPVNEIPAKMSNGNRAAIEKDIEAVVTSVENAQLDLTADYDHWIQLGFALAHELGEAGRGYFHRLSRFHPRYDYEKTNQKYTNCLQHKTEGITIKTFFYLAKNAGIAIGGEKKNNNAQEQAVNNKTERDPGPFFDTPLLPVEVYDHLPKMLHDCCRLFKPGIEKDIFLLSALTVLSGCLPNVEGIYFNRHLSAHLYLFITGPSASGKGTMLWARYLAQSIHESMVSETIARKNEYKQQLDDYEHLSKSQKIGMERPEEPERKMLFIPANSSNAALTQLLAENNFRGIIFESEADTLSNTTKQDWGDSSDIFRKAFHHENTSMARRLNRELIEITDPHLAICLSGTPKQVHHLMPEVENGLFSRFMYYAFHDNRGFMNPFISHQDIDYQHYFTQKSYEVFHFHEKLKKLEKPIRFHLTKKQGEHFTRYFQQLLDKNKLLLSSDLDANTKRLGVISYRLAMIISVLRLMDVEIGKPWPSQLTCSDSDYQTAMLLTSTLESHAVAVYQRMPRVHLQGARLMFYEKLPEKFTRKEYLAIANQLGIPSKTADKYIAIFTTTLLNHSFNEYTKIK